MINNPYSVTPERDFNDGGKIVKKHKFKELHLPGYNYCGPGTDVVGRYMRGDRGINFLDDQGCRIHDWDYMRFAINKTDTDDQKKKKRIKLKQADERLKNIANTRIGHDPFASLVYHVFDKKGPVEDFLKKYTFGLVDIQSAFAEPSKELSDEQAQILFMRDIKPTIVPQFPYVPNN